MAVALVASCLGCSDKSSPRRWPTPADLDPVLPIARLWVLEPELRRRCGGWADAQAHPSSGDFGQMPKGYLHYLNHCTDERTGLVIEVSGGAPPDLPTAVEVYSITVGPPGQASEPARLPAALGVAREVLRDALTDAQASGLSQMAQRQWDEVSRGYAVDGLVVRFDGKLFSGGAPLLIVRLSRATLFHLQRGDGEFADGGPPVWRRVVGGAG